MSLCLTRAELCELTGYRRRSKVIAWLKANGFRPRVAADGWPRIDRNLYAQVMAGAVRNVSTEPNYESIK